MRKGVTNAVVIGALRVNCDSKSIQCSCKTTDKITTTARHSALTKTKYHSNSKSTKCSYKNYIKFRTACIHK